MTDTQTTTQYVDALTAAYEVMLDAMRANSTTAVRFSQRVLDETQEAQKRAFGVARRMAENPTDLAGNVSALIEANAESQSQAIALAREWIETASSRREQARELVERSAKANQDVIRAAFAASRDLYTANPLAQIYRSAGE